MKEAATLFLFLWLAVSSSWYQDLGNSINDLGESTRDGRGIIIVPPWIKNDESKTPMMYWNWSEDGRPDVPPFSEPDLRRI